MMDQIRKNRTRQRIVAEKVSRLLRELAETRREYRDVIDPEHADFLDSTMDGLHILRNMILPNGDANGRGV